MSFRTDLAMERLSGVSTRAIESLPPGIDHESNEIGSIEIDIIDILDDKGEAAIGKPQGRYITVTTPPLYGSSELEEDELEAVASQLAEMLPEEGLLLVVGLGNNDITPDAIGPRSVHQVLATRHFSGEAAQQAGLGALRPVAALSPGVLGQTGIETSEIIASVAKDIKPAAIIVIDALAAREAKRLGTTLQFANTGISPGSGVQNRRKELSKETLGIPVISVGVPTVIDSSTFANDILEQANPLYNQQSMVNDEPVMMITPREIDVLVGHAGKTLSLIINKAIHRELGFNDIQYLMS